MKLRYPQEGGHEYSASEYNVIRILKVRCGHRTLRLVIIKVHSVWVDDHIDPRSGERVSPVSPAGRQEKSAKKLPHRKMRQFFYLFISGLTCLPKRTAIIIFAQSSAI